MPKMEGEMMDTEDPNIESRRIRQHRAWYAETAARRKEWEDRDLNAEDPDLTTGECVGLVFVLISSAMILAGGLFWALDYVVVKFVVG
jgi:hypothetical protein